MKNIYCLFFICFLTVAITSVSSADYDELPKLNNISAISIYNMDNYTSIPSESQAVYNITDSSIIADIYNGLTKKQSSWISQLQAVTEGVVYIKLNDGTYKEASIIDDWNILYVYSDEASNNIYYEISSIVKTLLINNSQ